MGKPVNSKNSAVNGTRNGGIRATKNSPSASLRNTSKGHNVGGDGKTSFDTGKATADRSQLNFPYDVRLAGFTSLQNAVSKGTPRIKRILMEECDYIMECRVCRNLFRTVPNFVSHKMNYCKKAFDSTFCLGLSNLLPSGGDEFKIQYEVDPELIMDDNWNSYDTSNARSVADFYNELSLRAKAMAEVSFAGQREEKSTSSALPLVKENIVRLQIKPLVESLNGSVVLQQKMSCDQSTCDITSSFVNPFQKVVQKDTAILGPEGNVMFTGTKKGIEQIAAKLAARIRADEEKLLQNNNPGAVLCDTCKTLFGSEKAVRQHKRESPDCCKTWPFKSPAKRAGCSSNSSGNPYPNNSEHPCSQGGTEAQENNNALHDLRTDASAPSSNRLPKSPMRRLSYKKIFQSPLKPQRSLPLSPAKKIKMKYIKLENSSAGGENNVAKAETSSHFSCNRCSASFGTKHQMSMHLALCSGVINYADLRESDSPSERISISARHDFAKSSKSSIQSSYVSTSRSVSTVSSSTTSVATEAKPPPRSPTKPGNLSSSPHVKDQKRKRPPAIPALNFIRDSDQEVNNNKQYKSSAQVRCKTNSIEVVSSLMSEPVPVVPEARNCLEVVASGDMDLDLSNSDVTSLVDTDSGVSSEFPSSGQPDQNDTVPKKKVKSSVVKSGKGKPKITLVSQVFARPENKTIKTQNPFNLRKAARFRIRKSGRHNQVSSRSGRR